MSAVIARTTRHRHALSPREQTALRAAARVAQTMRADTDEYQEAALGALAALKTYAAERGDLGAWCTLNAVNAIRMYRERERRRGVVARRHTRFDVAAFDPQRDDGAAPDADPLDVLLADERHAEREAKLEAIRELQSLGFSQDEIRVVLR